VAQVLCSSSSALHPRSELRFGVCACGSASRVMYSSIRVAPDRKYLAEVVVFLTTLGAKRAEFNAGKRARDLLEIKRVHFKIIDFNKDSRLDDGEETEAIQKLLKSRQLQYSCDNEFVMPQIFVDGNNIGDATDLQGLEDESQLDRILFRQACPKCLKKRTPAAKHCFNCNADYDEILPGVLGIDEYIEELGELEPEYFDSVVDEVASIAADKPSGQSSDTQAGAPSTGASARAADATLKSAGADSGTPTKRDPTPTAAGEQVPAAAAVPEEVPLTAPAPENGTSPVAAAPEEKEVARLGANEQSTPEYKREKPAGKSRQTLLRTPSLLVASFEPEPDTVPMRPSKRPDEKPAAVPPEVSTTVRYSSAEARPPSPQADGLPVLKGHLWKKSPSKWRLSSYDWRFFVVREMQMLWWRSEEEASTPGAAAADGGPLCKGSINFLEDQIAIEVEESNDTTFTLGPASGEWADRTLENCRPSRRRDTLKDMFRDKAHRATRIFTFDASSSENDRCQWMDGISKHIAHAARLDAGGASAPSTSPK